MASRAIERSGRPAKKRGTSIISFKGSTGKKSAASGQSSRAKAPQTSLNKNPGAGSVDTVSGMNLEGESFRIGVPHHMTINCEGLGKGSLEMSCKPSNAAKIEIAHSGKKLYFCQISPRKEGQFEISVKFGKKHIENSPFHVLFHPRGDASKCHIVDTVHDPQDAAATVVCVSTAGAGQGTLTATVSTKTSHKELSTTVTRQTDDHFDVEFVPNEDSEYILSIWYDNVHIQGSPFLLSMSDALKCRTEGKGLMLARVDQPNVFVVHAQNGGPGELFVEIKGKDTTLKPKVSTLKENQFEVAYTPSKIGTYDIAVLWSGEDIPGSPFKVPCYPQVKVTTPHPGKLGRYVAERPYEYSIDTDGAGEGTLTAHAHGTRTGKKPELPVEDKGGGKFSVTLTAKEADEYRVIIMWGDEHVSGSPFNLQVEEKPQLDNVVFNGPHYTPGSSEPVSLGVNTEKMGVGTLSASCYGVAAGIVHVNTEEKDSNNYTITFSPPTQDVYFLSVLWSGENVKDSPLKISTIPPSAGNCIVGEPEIPVKVGKPVKLRVDATKAGSGELVAKAVADKSDPARVHVHELEAGIFDISVKPSDPDYYTLFVTWSDKPVPGSPFHLNLNAADASAVIIQEPPSGVMKTGQAIGILFNTSKAGLGKMKASCKGDQNVGEIPVTITKRSAYTYYVEVTPPEEDLYFLKVSWGGHSIKGSPFTLDLIPIDASKVEVLGPRQVGGLQSEVEVTLWTEEAGAGEVTSTCVGMEAGDVPVVIKKISKDSYRLQFLPPKQDIYSLSMFFGGEHVSRSPLRVNTLPPDVNKIRLTMPPQMELFNPVIYKCDVEDAGAGELTATCYGEQYGPIEIDIVEDTPVMFELSLEPYHPDIYHISIFWGGIEIPNSPFEMNLIPAEASKVKVGPLHAPEDAGTGEPAWIELDCTETGPGEVTAECKGNSVGEIKVEIENPAKNKYKLKFYPEKADVYYFSVYYESHHVPGSTFEINLIPPQPDRVKHINTSLPEKSGMPACLSFDTKEAGRGSLSAKVSGEQAGSVPNEIKEESADIFDIFFTPPKPDIYTVDVFWADMPVKDSPFTVDTRPPVFPENVKCGELLYTLPGEPASLTADTSTAGPGTLTAKCQGEKSGEMSVKIIATAENVHNVSFVPQIEDIYTLWMFYNETEIKESPFTADIRSYPERVIHTNTSLPEESGNPAYLSFDTKDAGRGVLTATASGESAGPISAEVRQKSQNEFDVVFVPPQPDLYTVNVLWSDKPVKDSPFTVDTQLPVFPENVKCGELLYTLPGEPASLTADTSTAGPGTLTAKCQGVKSNDVAVEITATAENIYSVSFIPEVEDIYNLSIFYQDTEVISSPFTADLRCYPDRVKHTGTSLPDETSAPVTLTFNTKEAGRGVLSAKVSGDSVGSVPVQVEETTPDEYNVTFVSLGPDLYSVETLWSEKQVKDSPFTVDLRPHADGVVHTGTSLPEEAGAPIVLSFDAKEAGRGSMNAKTRGESVGPIATDVKEIAPKQFSVAFTPPKPDLYSVDVTWSDQPVNNSPFTIDTRPPVFPENVKCGELLYTLPGEPASLTADASTAGPGTLTANCIGEKSGEVPVKVTAAPDRDGEYNFTFKPPMADLYTISVFYEGAEVNDSPFIVDLRCYPDRVKHTGTVLPEEAEAPVLLNFDTKDAGRGTLTAKVAGESAGPLSVDVTGAVSSEPTVSFVSPQPDLYKVEVLWSDQQVKDSPFSVDLRSYPDQVEHVRTSLPEEAGAPVALIFDTKDAGRGSLSAKAVGNSAGPVATEVKKKPMNEFDVMFIPPESDLYEVNVYWSDKPVKDSPFTVDTRPPVFPENVKCGELLFTLPGEPASLTADTSTAGPGTLTAKCKGDKSGNVPVAVEATSESDFEISFKPEIEDLYTVSVFYEDTEVKDSPFTADLRCYPDRVKHTGTSLPDETSAPVTLTFNTKEAGRGVLSAKVSGDAVGSVPVYVEETTPDEYSVTFVSLEPDNYTVDVLWSGKPVKDSPFSVDLRSYPDRVEHIRTSLPEEAGAPVALIFDTKEAGRGSPSAKVVGESAGSVSSAVEETAPNEFSIAFTPPKEDMYTVDVLWSDKPVKSSPFTIDTRPPVRPENVKCGELLFTVPGKPASLTADTSNAGPGTLTAECTGEKAGDVKVKITSTSKTDYNITFKPKKVDVYTLSVFYDGTEVEDSPFSVDFRSFPDRVQYVGTEIPEEREKPVYLSFDTKEAGRGIMTAKVSGNSAGRVRGVDIKEISPNAFNVSFHAPKPDIYKVDVLWSDTQVNYSPFTVDTRPPSYPENVKCGDLVFTVPGKPASLKADTSTAGYGTLTAKCTGEKSGKVDVKVVPTADSAYNITFKPKKEDVYTLSVFFEGIEVQDSPFTGDLRAYPDHVVHTDTSVPEEAGAPVTLSFDATDAGKGSISSKVVGESVGPVPVDVESTPPKYKVAFISSEPDIYKVDVLWSDKPVRGSPFVIDTRPPVRPENVKCGELLFTLPGEPASLTADTSTAGPGTLTAKCKGDKSGNVDVEIIATSKDEYSISFRPMNEDIYTLSVFFDDQEVNDSPFTGNLLSYPDRVEHTGTSLPEETGDPVALFFDAKDAGRGLPTAKAAGETVGPISVDVKETLPKFNVEFVPPKPDLYTVDVFWSNRSVKSSPFIIDTRPPVYPENVKCGELLFTLPGEPASLTADTSTAGPGTLTAKCQGDKSGNVGVKIIATSKDEYSISFRPMKEDIYTLSVFFDDQEVNDSPFTGNLLSYPDRVEHTGTSLPEETGDPVALFFDAKDAGRGLPTAKAAGESVGPISVDVKKTLPKFNVEFVPPKPDLYTVDVFWSNRSVKSSPFTIDTRPPTRPENVECGDLIFSVPGKPASLEADTSTAGPGTLTAKCRGEKSGVVPVEIDETAEEKFNISFLPKREDIYTLSVFYNTTEVRESPFVINLHPEKLAEEIIEMPVFSEMPVESIFIPGDFDDEVPKEPEDEEEKPLTLFIEDPLNLMIGTEKEGELVATASGEKTGPAEIDVSRDKDDKHIVLFDPDKPDLYTIDVKWNEEHVPSSPFLVKYIRRTDPSKCRIFGLKDFPPVYQPDDEISFGVDAQNAGDGKLLITADGPSSKKKKSKIEIRSSEDNPAIYNITYHPTASGLHRLHIHWADVPIPGSPVTFQVGDGRPVQSYAYGEPVSLEVHSTTGMKDLVCYAVHEDSGKQFDLNTSELREGKFIFFFEDPGFYWIHIQDNGKEIPGSPYRIRYANPPDPGACKVIGFNSKGYLAIPTHFSIDCSKAESGSLHVKATDPSDDGQSDLKITDEKNGIYSVEYIPKTVGIHQFKITWARASIPGSPFHINVTEFLPEIKTVLKGESSVNIVALGESAEVQIDNVGQHEGDDFIIAHASGEKSGAAEVAVKKEEESYFISFIPSAEDDYTFEIKIKDDDVEGSPFVIKAVEKDSLAKDFIHPEGACHSDVLVGQDVNLIVQANEAKAASDLTVRNEGPAGECDTSVSGEVEGKVGLSFLPTTPGDYLVHVMEKDEDVSGSPFKIRVLGIKSRVTLLKEFSESQKLGDPVEFHVSTIRAGPGNLRITSTGPGKAEVKVIDNKDEVYTCEFKPRVAGKYHLNILWNGEHIRGSPYLLNFLSSHKSLAVFGLELEHVDFHVGVPYMFKLDCEEVGQGILQITCRPQNAAEINLIPVGAHNHYHCEIIPREPGNHVIAVQYNDKHILGSPFNVHFSPSSDASKCQVIQSSVENVEEGINKVTLCVSTEGGGEGELLASVKDAATKEQLPIIVSRSTENEKQYTLEFSIRQGMEYLVSITYGEQHIPQSPFKLSFAGPKGAAHCHAEGEGLNSVQMGKWSQFTVNTADAGPGELSVKIEKEGEAIEPAKIITPLPGNQYEVGYLPTSLGMYTISVLWGDEHISESPFEVRSYHPANASLLSIPEAVSETYIDQPLQFTVKAEDVSEEGELEVILQSPGKMISGQGTKGEDGNYTCTVYAPEPGRYTAHVRWNGEHILGSPFKVKVMTPPKPENVRAYGPGLENGYVGQEGNFTVETGEGGAGVLAVDVQGPKGAFKINMRRHPDNDRTVLVRYNPIDVGPYVVDVMWSGVHVPGSPFKVNIAEQKKAKRERRR